jgi:tellurite resistance protein TerC
VYLSLGLAVILAFIGVKLVMEALHENTVPFINGGEHIDAVPTIPIWLSLSVILGVLVIATVASLIKTRGQMPELAATDPEVAEQVRSTGPEALAEAERRAESTAEAQTAEKSAATAPRPETR